MTSEASPASSVFDPALLGLHVLGGGVGESIVLELPQGGWGVIDCYAGKMQDPATNLTYQFLRERGVSELKFLALTHPHADHYRGLLDLLGGFLIRQFWRFGGLSSKELPRLVRGLREDAEQRQNERQSAEAVYLDDVLRHVNNLRRSEHLPMTAMADVKPLYPMPHGQPASPGEAQVFSIAPLTNTVETYQEQLARCFDRDDRLLPILPSLNQNTISAALRVVYGETTLILGGDVTSESWEEVIRSSITDNRWLACHAVKVSHHGSPTGYCAGLWALFCERGEAEAVITPFRRHRLPTLDTYDHIKEHTGRISTTCVPAIAFEAIPSHEFRAGTNPIAQIALREVFPEFRTVNQYQGGVCSFWFDNIGQMVRQEFIGAAGRL